MKRRMVAVAVVGLLVVGWLPVSLAQNLKAPGASVRAGEQRGGLLLPLQPPKKTLAPAPKTPTLAPPKVVLTPATPTPAKVAAEFKRAPFFRVPQPRVKLGQLQRREFDEQLLVVYQDKKNASGEMGFNLKGKPSFMLLFIVAVQIDDRKYQDQVLALKDRLSEHVANYLLNRTHRDLRKASEALRLKEIIILFLNDALPEACVREVYFNKYIVALAS